MKKVNDLLERAIMLSQDHLREATGGINEKRKGDIASFGTALMQSGLLPAVALFSDTGTNSGKRRNQMLNVLYALLGGSLTTQDISEHKKKLLASVLSKDDDARAAMRQELMTACIALKLAIRTFHLEKIKEENE